MFATVFAAFLIGHYLGDYFVQTDVQAQNKGRRGSRLENFIGRIHCFWHALGYTTTLAGVLGVALLVEGVEVGGRGSLVVWSALILNGITHYIIDRRWTLEAFARRIGKSGWIDNDPEALPKLDQAAHVVLLGAFALAIAALI
jgi:hypothetical protein